MAPRINFSLVEKYEKLPTIVKLREVIRKLWKLEVGFMDKHGFVLDHARGKVIPPENRFCQETLFCRDGLFLCDKSVSQLSELLKSGAYPKGCVFEGICHLGLKMLAVPYYRNGEYMGAIFSCGFLTESPDEEKVARINDKVQEYSEKFFNPGQFASDISVINQGSLDYLLELIRFGISEMESFHEEMLNKELEIEDLNNQLHEKYSLGSMIGKSKEMTNLFALIKKVALSDSTVLVTGENGTGKELVARAIHYLSLRKDNRFIAQNCSAFNDSLLDSELFGHIKGSFTGALRSKQGLFEAVDGGTFLLDEIADMSPSLQVKVLRVLQEGTLMPVGATEAKKVDVRIIAATNKDLKSLVEKGLFREDLFYRINVIKIEVPPLRDRREDIPLLVDHFVKKNARKMHRNEKVLTPDAMDCLVKYYWPGNVRQLENEIEKIFVLSADQENITKSMLSSEIRECAALTSDIKLSGNMKNAIESLEKKMIYEGLKKHNWNKSKLSKELGISRASLIMKSQKFGFEKEAYSA